MAVTGVRLSVAPCLAGSEHDLESGAAVDGDEILALELNLWWL
jgi:hypothetical protein